MAEPEGQPPPPRAPSYAQSQFDTIIHRKQNRTIGGLKLRKSVATSTFAQVEHSTDGPRGQRRWDCSPWGVVSYVDISDEDRKLSESKNISERKAAKEESLGPFLASAVAGVAVAGSPLYAFPPLVAVSGVYSPVCLLVVTLMLALWRPFVNELASALPRSGSNYFYLLNLSSNKKLAIFAASLTALDSIATSVVSAATAADYIAEQTSSSEMYKWLTVVLLVAIAAIGLAGIKQSASVTAATLCLHMLVMTILLVAAVVHWAKHGHSTLASNWKLGQYGSASETAKAIFRGICIGFLGVTGFETSPDYITIVRPKTFPTVLASLQAIAVYLNAPLMLVTFAVLPSASISNNSTVLSSLAEASAGAWLRILLAINAAFVLCAGILTGIISACELSVRLTEDGVMPRLFARQLPRTEAPWVSIATFLALCLVLYGTSATQLSILSGVFAVAFLSVMALFPLSALLLAYSRPQLARDHRTWVSMTVLTLAIALVVFVGNAVIAPATIGYFAAYLTALTAMLLAYSSRQAIWKVLWWTCDRSRFSKAWCAPLEKRILESTDGSSAVVVFAKTDEVSRLFKMLSYVFENERTSNVKLVHFYEDVDCIPSELEANYKILDEAFPSITVDLTFVQGRFDLTNVHVVCERYNVPRGLAFMGCPDQEKGQGYGDFRDLRIISA